MSDHKTKLCADIIHSSVWRQPDHVLRLWVAMLALSNDEGFVGASIVGLADAARITVDQCRSALELFMSPDPDSRSQTFEGRRVKKASRGWVLLNHQRINVDDYREREKARKRKWWTEHRSPKARVPRIGLAKAQPAASPSADTRPSPSGLVKGNVASVNSRMTHVASALASALVPTCGSESTGDHETPVVNASSNSRPLSAVMGHQNESHVLSHVTSALVLAQVPHDDAFSSSQSQNPDPPPDHPPQLNGSAVGNAQPGLCSELQKFTNIPPSSVLVSPLSLDGGNSYVSSDPGEEAPETATGAPLEPTTYSILVALKPTISRGTVADKVARRIQLATGKRWGVEGHAPDLIWIADQPAVEFERVLAALAASAWVRSNPGRATPTHIRKQWPRYSDGPERPEPPRGPLHAPAAAEFAGETDDFERLVGK